MAIKKEFIGTQPAMDPGEHLVKIIEVKSGLSKKGKPMLTVSFENAAEASIRGFYLKETDFQKKQLNSLKAACGLSEKDAATDLVGCQCGIAVELDKKPDDRGKHWPRIVGYGKPEDVEEQPAPNDFGNPPVFEGHGTDDIPF